VILNPISIGTRGYVTLAAVAIATFGYVQVDDIFYASGGFDMAGAATFSTVTSVSPNGGVVMSGAATIDFIPGGGGGARKQWYRLGLGV
jgi:hypothetical protein